MKRLLFILTFLLASQTMLHAQKFATTYYNPKIDNFSFHFGIGVASYAGDVASFGTNLFPTLERLQSNIGIAYRLKPNLRARWQLTYYGIDANTYKARYLDIGDKSRRSGPAINGLLESNISLIYDFVSKDVLDKGLKKFNIYGVMGLGLTTLRKSSLSISGQVKAKAPVTPILLLGGGLEYYVRKNISIAFEYGFRLTATDLFDNIKGNTSVPDNYLFYGYKVNYAPTHGFSLNKYRKKHQNQGGQSDKKFLGLF